VVREEESGLEEAFLMSRDNGAPFDGTVALYLSRVRWDGSTTETLDLGCR
jgi:hypothetical protein